MPWGQSPEDPPASLTGAAPPSVPGAASAPGAPPVAVVPCLPSCPGNGVVWLASLLAWPKAAVVSVRQAATLTPMRCLECKSPLPDKGPVIVAVGGLPCPQE